MTKPNGINKTNFEQVIEFSDRAKEYGVEIDSLLSDVRKYMDKVDEQDTELYFGTKSAVQIKDEFIQLYNEFYKFKEQVDKNADDAKEEADRIKNT